MGNNVNHNNNFNFNFNNKPNNVNNISSISSIIININTIINTIINTTINTINNTTCVSHITIRSRPTIASSLHAPPLGSYWHSHAPSVDVQDWSRQRGSGPSEDSK